MAENAKVAAARAEAEAAQAGLVSAVGSFGTTAGSAKDEVSAKAERFAPIAIAAAGALVAISVVRKLR